MVDSRVVLGQCAAVSSKSREMVFLSVNGVVLGQFEESSVPGMVARREITSAAFYWREGMPEWRPVAELAGPPAPVAPPKPVLPKIVAAPAVAVEHPAGKATDKTEAQATSRAFDPAKTTLISVTPAATGGREASGAPAAAAGSPAAPPRKLVIPARSAEETAPNPGRLVIPARKPAASTASSVAAKSPIAAPVVRMETAAERPVAGTATNPAPTVVPKIAVPLAVAVARPVPSRAAAKSPIAAPVVRKETKEAVPERSEAPSTENLAPKAVAPLAMPPRQGLLPSTEDASSPVQSHVSIAPRGTKVFAPRAGEPTPHSAQVPHVGPQPTAPAIPETKPSPSAPTKRRKWPLVFSALAVLALAAGGGAWWWLNAEPPTIPGKIALSGSESGPVKLGIYRRTDLAAPWRDRLADADARGGDIDKLVAGAEARSREKSLLLEEAESVLKVGEEYNMPDLAELRADRDAKKAEAEAARAELDKIQSEKSGLLTIEAFLESAPAPAEEFPVDAQGNFSLRSLAPGEFVLLATVSEDGGGQKKLRGWLQVLEVPAEGAGPSSVEFTEANRLDLDGIRKLVGTADP